MTLGEFVVEVNPPPDDPLPPRVIEPVGETIDRTFEDARSAKATVKRMAKAVVTGQDEDDPEDERNLTPQQRGGDNIASAFDRGARLSMPEPPKGDLDDSYRAAKERIQSQMRTGTRPSRAGKASSAGLAGTDELTKLFATGFITLVTFTLGEDFLPTAEEATELTRPLANILSRRIDIAAKLGKDGNDTIAFAIAVMAYLVRVGPVAKDKVQYAWQLRQERQRVDRIIPDRPYDANGEDGVAAGSNAGTGASNGATYNPVDALTKARDTQLRGLDRDFGYDQGRDLALGSVR